MGALVLSRRMFFFFSSRSGDLLGGGHVAVPVEADDASEGGEGVDVVRCGESLVDVVGRGETAGVGVLHDHRSGLLEVHADVQGLVQVQDVVVGQLLPVLQELRLGDGGTGRERVLVERGGLVGVLTVPEVLHLLEGYRERLGESLAELPVHPGSDHVVVVGGDDERLRHELAQEPLTDGPAVGLHVGDDLGVLVGVGDDGHGLVVLGRSADHAGAAYVDVLDDLVEGNAVLQDRLLERIEVDDDHVDGLDAHRGDRIHMLLEVPAGQDPRVDLRVEGLDAPVEHLREPGDIGYLDDRHAVLFQNLVGPAGGDDLHAHGGQLLSEFYDAGLVRDADDCSADFRQWYTPSSEARIHIVCINRIGYR